MAMLSTGAVNGELRRAGVNGFQPYHATSVPRGADLEVAYGVTGLHRVTTAMLRNIPNRYNQAHLLQEISDMGFAGTFDFFYLPMDTLNRSNVGYAFVNFLAPTFLHAFAESFTGYMFQRYPSQKIATVVPAHIQGFEENVRHFANRAVTQSRNSQYRPLVLLHGRQMDLGEALLEISQPGHEAAAGFPLDGVPFMPHEMPYVDLGLDIVDVQYFQDLAFATLAARAGKQEAESDMPASPPVLTTAAPVPAPVSLAVAAAITAATKNAASTSMQGPLSTTPVAASLPASLSNSPVHARAAPPAFSMPCSPTRGPLLSPLVPASPISGPAEAPQAEEDNAEKAFCEAKVSLESMLSAFLKLKKLPEVTEMKPARGESDAVSSTEDNDSEHIGSPSSLVSGSPVRVAAA